MTENMYNTIRKVSVENPFELLDIMEETVGLDIIKEFVKAEESNCNTTLLYAPDGTELVSDQTTTCYSVTTPPSNTNVVVINGGTRTYNINVDNSVNVTSKTYHNRQTNIGVGTDVVDRVGKFIGDTTSKFIKGL